MSNTNLIGTWIRRFLMEHLVGERNLARNTQSSYRDTLALRLPFIASKIKLLQMVRIPSESVTITSKPYPVHREKTEQVD